MTPKHQLSREELIGDSLPLYSEKGFLPKPLEYMFEAGKRASREETKECDHYCPNCDRSLSTLISEAIRRREEELIKEIEDLPLPYASPVSSHEEERNDNYDQILREVIALIQKEK